MVSTFALASVVLQSITKSSDRGSSPRNAEYTYIRLLKYIPHKQSASKARVQPAMDQPSIFSSTLGLATPWQITRVDVSKEHPRFDIYISCNQSVSMPCPLCGQDATICGLAQQSWHHDDFFSKDAYLHVAVPVVRCKTPCGVHKVRVPWSHPGSRFVLVNDP